MPKVSKEEHKKKMMERTQKKDYKQLLQDAEYEPRIHDELVKLGMIEDPPIEDAFTAWLQQVTI
jgi:hypothetical protein